MLIISMSVCKFVWRVILPLVIRKKKKETFGSSNVLYLKNANPLAIAYLFKV